MTLRAYHVYYTMVFAPLTLKDSLKRRFLRGFTPVVLTVRS